MAAEVPPVDAHRVELAHKHVSALNNQFARWVQSQLQNHPYELWEDGVGDYLSHASNIMEKFGDVVAWLKASATKEEETQSAEGNASGFPYMQKYILETNESVPPNSQLQIRSGIIQDGASVPSAWSSGTEFSSHASQNLPVKDTVKLEFNHYTAGSRWRQADISRKDHMEEGNETDGFYGGIRKLTSEDEISTWRRIWPMENLDQA